MVKQGAAQRRMKTHSNAEGDTRRPEETDPNQSDLRDLGSAAHSLTKRQCELLELVAEGKSSKQIAAATGMAVASIDNALSRAARTLNARNRREAATQFALLRLQGWEPQLGLDLPGMINVAIDSAASTNDPNADPDGQRNGGALAFRVIRALAGPPFGGRAAPDNWRSIVLQILWVAFIATVAVTGTTLLILAFYATFAAR